MKLSTPARVWYVLMNVGLGGGYFAKIPVKKALAEAGLATMTSAETLWYRLMCISFGAGYFLKIPAAKALSESPLGAPSETDVDPPVPPAAQPPSRIAPILAVAATVIAATAAIWAFATARPASISPVAAQPPGWHFDGLYRIDIDFPHGILRTHDGELIDMGNGGPPATSVDSARKTTCDEAAQCETISIQLDGTGEKTSGRSRWTGTQWVSDNDGPNHGTVSPNPCPDDESVSDRWEEWNEMTPLMDGTFSGTLHQRVITDECGGSGGERTVPLTVTRIGDAPVGIFD